MVLGSTLLWFTLTPLSRPLTNIFCSPLSALIKDSGDVLYPLIKISDSFSTFIKSCPEKTLPFTSTSGILLFLIAFIRSLDISVLVLVVLWLFAALLMLLGFEGLTEMLSILILLLELFREVSLRLFVVVVEVDVSKLLISS